MTFEEALVAWLPEQRWFAGKGTPITGLAITADTTLVAGDPGLRHLILAVEQGSGTDAYQVFAGTRAQLPAGWSTPGSGLLPKTSPRTTACTTRS
jgi:maltokinase